MSEQRLEGQGLVEYGMILALVALGCIIALGVLGGSISSAFDGFAAVIPGIGD